MIAQNRNWLGPGRWEPEVPDKRCRELRCECVPEPWAPGTGHGQPLTTLHSCSETKETPVQG